jgi:hypothetical protein
VHSTTTTRSNLYTPLVVQPAQLLAVFALALIANACAQRDPARHLATELAFLRTGVHIDSEEREVRRVFAQRGLRVVARLAGPSYVALGAATRQGEQSAVRIITQRGVVLAEDASATDLFQPGTVALIEHFGGSLGEYVVAASARVPSGRELGCVTLHRILPDGSVVASTLDVSVFGSLACVANLAPGSGGRIRATVAWPALHALITPSVEVELAFVEPLVGREPPRVPRLKVANQGEWLERERARVSTMRLARAPFSERHAIGVARAALAALAGVDTAQQIAIYREAVQAVLPASPEAEVLTSTVEHIERGWLEPDEPSVDTPEAAPPDEQAGAEGGEPPEEVDPDAIVIEPDAP